MRGLDGAFRKCLLPEAPPSHRAWRFSTDQSIHTRRQSMIARLARLGISPFPLGWAAIVGALVLLLGGCSRAYYRRQADQDAYALIREKAADPRWPLENYTVQPDPRSRLFDPFNPDRPPMPPDDPTSHQLMHWIDGKRAWPHWNRHGEICSVENCRWKEFLPYDDQGTVVLNRETAMEAALLHSREYQRAVESLYLSALDVAYQRFRFDVQFFGTNTASYSLDSRIRGTAATRNTLENDTSLQMRRLFATGGELVAGVANSLVWQLSGPQGANVNTLVDYTLVQPLLRAGGRAIVLERLTDAERGLVANVRQMEHFRRGFYAQVVTGRSPGTGPSRGGLSVGSFSPGGGGAAGGFFGLLGDQVKIRNQRANMVSLQDSWRRLEEFYQAGRVSRYQVDQTRQSLYNSQSQLLALSDAYLDRLENYLISLGLPPNLRVKISDPLVSQFDLISPELTSARDSVNALLERVRNPAQAWSDEINQSFALVVDAGLRQLAAVEKDVQSLAEVLPKREEDLRNLASRPELLEGEVDRSAYSADALRGRARAVHEDFAALKPRLQRTLAGLKALGQVPAEAPKDQPKPEPPRERLADQLSQLANQLLELSSIQARARLDTIRLVPVDLDPAEALKIACEHRLDWMNARAALVDVWRQIEVQANALRAGLDLTLSGALTNTDNNPINFHSTRGQLRFGVQFDAPLTRMLERNAYRESLIAYQQARREYLLFADRLEQELRNTLRTMRTGQLDFELRRAAVFLAISQVDQARLRLEVRPKPGETFSLGDTAARDLLDALSNLLQGQNNLLSAWLNYEAQRITLDFDLGTMQLDGRGLWIDPGPILPKKTPPETPEATPATKVVAPEPDPLSLPKADALPSKPGMREHVEEALVMPELM